MKRNVHILEALPLVEQAQYRRNVKLLDSIGEQRARADADKELLALLIAFLVAMTACGVVWSYQAGFWPWVVIP